MVQIWLMDEMGSIGRVYTYQKRQDGKPRWDLEALAEIFLGSLAVVL
jgi:hypothetical protein